MVRRAEPSDAETVAPLLAELGYPCTAEDVRRRLREIESSALDATFVAIAGGPVGLASVHLIRMFHLDAPVARITSFVVAQRVRRRGIGGLLLSTCELHARENGAAHLEVTSADRRADAHAFYVRHGYAREAQRFTKRLSY